MPFPFVSAALAVRRQATAHWPFLAVCALFLLVSALVLDDYGLSTDELGQRLIGQAALASLAGGGDQALDQVFTLHDRYYGPVFEVPLVLVERVLGLESGRDIYLARHFLTHLFFLAGGVFCYLLVLRMFGNRLLALVALVLFLLHPRLYAHSFFNSKDIPFLVMFMVSLYLVHRAFRRDTLGAFLLCGVGMGLLVNLRVMGIMLFAAVLALRALDMAFAGRAGERRRVLLTGGAFALAAVLTYYAVFPLLWPDPVGRFGEVWAFGSSHPNPAYNLFRGEQLFGPDGPPLEYVPVWIGITTPPATLLLALAGGGVLAWRGLRRPRAVLRNGSTRFGFLLLAVPVVTMVGVVAIGSNIYNGWRLLYFLYAPLLLLAVLGLHWLATLLPGRWPRLGACVLVGMGVAVALVSMARIHPLEGSYYNGLVDRTTPDHLASRYDMDYWTLANWNLVREVVDDYPDQAMLVVHRNVWRQAWLLSELERGRISLSSKIVTRGFYSDQDISDKNYEVTIYNNTLTRMEGRQLQQGGRRKEIISAVMAGEPVTSVLEGEPVARSVLDIYHDGYELVFVTDGHWCREGTHLVFIHVHIYPVDPNDLPDEHQQTGFDRRGFLFWDYGTWLGDHCFAFFSLPVWPISHIDAGQFNQQGTLWESRFSLAPPETHSRALAGEPLVDSTFEIHRDGDELVYVRDGCSERDAGTAFFLHIVPVDPDDLPAAGRQHGFENRDFRLWERGGRWRERCTAAVPLPDYPIARVRTGQYDDTGRLWAVEFAPGGGK